MKVEPGLASDSRVREPAPTFNASPAPRNISILRPGLRSSFSPGVNGELTIANPEGLTAYGPTAKLEEKFVRGFVWICYASIHDSYIPCGKACLR